MVGKVATSLKRIDIEATGNGIQLNTEHCSMLIAPMTMMQINNALKKIIDLIAPDVDGYGANFFKATWNIIKGDIIEAVQDFFC